MKLDVVNDLSFWYSLLVSFLIQLGSPSFARPIVSVDDGEKKRVLATANGLQFRRVPRAYPLFPGLPSV